MVKHEEEVRPGFALTGKRHLARSASGALLALLASTVAPLAFAAVTGTPAYAGTQIPADPSSVQPGTWINDYNEAAVQFIETNFSATLAVPVPTVNQAALGSLENTLAAEVANGTIGSDQASILNAMSDAIANNPLGYLVSSGQVQTESATIQAYGTGWVISPNGYIVTADHVVDPANPEIKQTFASTGLASFDKQAAQQLIQGLQSSGVTPTDHAISHLTSAVAAFLAQNLTLQNVTSTITAQLGTAVTGVGLGTKPIAAEWVSNNDGGAPYPGHDVAILKVEGQGNMPTVSLGNDSDVTTGDSIYVLGYPAASTFEAGASASSQLVPTLTIGTLTAQKQAANTAMPVDQISAAISPGSSGSPVFDGAGNVVAMAVAGSVDSNGSQIPGQYYAIPISIVREFLQRSNVSPSVSDTTTIYDQAMDDMYQHFDKRALPLLRQVQNLYPRQPFVGGMLQTAQTCISTSGCDKTPSFPWVILIVIIAVIVVAGGGGGGFLVMRRKRPAIAAAPTGGYGAPPVGEAYPGEWQPSPAAAYRPEPPPFGTAPPRVPTPGAETPASVMQPIEAPETAGRPTVPVGTPSGSPEIAGQAPEEAPATSEPSKPAAAGKAPSKFCSECGAAFSETAKFCPECGHTRGS